MTSSVHNESEEDLVFLSSSVGPEDSDTSEADSIQLGIARFMASHRLRRTLVGHLDYTTGDAPANVELHTGVDYRASLQSDVGIGLSDMASLVYHGVGCVVLAEIGVSTHPESDDIPRDAPNHIELAAESLGAKLTAVGLPTDFLGYLDFRDETSTENRLIAILSPESRHPTASAPNDFEVVAIMAAFNEADIIESTIRYLNTNGVAPYVIDNWSTDGTFEILQRLEAEGLTQLERFPASGPSDVFAYKDILMRQEELALQVDADWIIRHDVDERRVAPWPDVTLKDAIYHVHALGYSAIDHTLMTFHPTDDGFRPEDEPSEYFRYFEFEPAAWAFTHVKAWRKQPNKVDLFKYAGHDVGFDGKRVFPYKFTLMHYPVRTQEQGTRKVLRERKARWDPRTRSIGWHVHYDHVEEGHSFVKSPSELTLFEPSTFYSRYLVQRLSGIGVPGRPAGA